MRIEHRTAFIVCGFALLAFVLLASQVATDGYLAATVDPAVSHWLATRRSPALNGLFMLVTRVHSTVGIDVMLAFAASYYGLVGQRWREALWLIVAVESSMLLNVILKEGFARHRPDIDMPLVHLSSLSFPSGHALASSVLWGCLLLLWPPDMGRRAAGAVAIVVVGLVCTSRVYLGAHFLTDVLAGLSEGLFCTAAWSLALPASRCARRGHVR